MSNTGRPYLNRLNRLVSSEWYFPLRVSSSWLLRNRQRQWSNVANCEPSLWSCFSHFRSFFAFATVNAQSKAKRSEDSIFPDLLFSLWSVRSVCIPPTGEMRCRIVRRWRHRQSILDNSHLNAKEKTLKDFNPNAFSGTVPSAAKPHKPSMTFCEVFSLLLPLLLLLFSYLLQYTTHSDNICTNNV